MSSELRFTILGCGSSGGVPRLGGHWGDCDPENPRNVRLAPYHTRLAEQKAEFWPVSGWEVAQWYGENVRLLEK